MRQQAFMKVQQKIKKAGLTSDQEKQLHVAIQGYFREWFVQTQQYKSITDMVKMIDQEFWPTITHDFLIHVVEILAPDKNWKKIKFRICQFLKKSEYD